MPDILVIDDDPSIQKFLHEMLTRDGHSVVVAASGKDALTQIAAREYDLALIDVQLGDMSGLDVLMVLRQTWPNTVAIILTAHASLDTAVEALRQGAHDYLFKPCKTLALRESMRSGLEKRQQALQHNHLLTQLATVVERLKDPAVPSTDVPSAPPLPTSTEAATASRFVQRPHLTIDLQRHAVTLDGCELELTPTEFSLLAFLASESPRVIPPQELLRAAQGYDCEPWEARDLLRYHIHRIRQKARAATGGTYEPIRTVRGIGYALV